MSLKNMSLFSSAVLTPQGWRRNVRVVVTDGIITTMTADTQARSLDMVFPVLLPPLCNLHSHAFQRGMAGLAEQRGPYPDSFWTWRDIMYRFALNLSPEQLRAIAAWLYVEMLEAGFSRVGEFHYLHHDKDGRQYSDIGEMSAQITAAAELTGINLTLLPVFYAHSDFGGKAPKDTQRRFINDVDHFACLFERCRDLVSTSPGWRLGIAPHSLRAVCGNELQMLTELCPEGPVHIHIAEQTGEVDACLANYGARPVEWLLDNAHVDHHWCLVHATHITRNEVQQLASSGAVAGLCPITESNLGDGIFPTAGYLAAGGKLGIGSDSNILVSGAEELRTLEYTQRLALRQRNVIAAAEGSCGRHLFETAYVGGAQALADPGLGLSIGASADMVVLRDDIGSLVGDNVMVADAWLDRWIFTGSIKPSDVWVGGQHVVQNGRHVAHDQIAADFVRTVQAVLATN